MTMITPSYLGETIEYSSLHACRSTLEDPTYRGAVWGFQPVRAGTGPRDGISCVVYREKPAGESIEGVH